MEIKREDITHLAELSNFALSEEEITALGDNISDIIKYISQLDELDTEGVEPTFSGSDLENIWRPDEIQPQEADREALLALTVATENHQIKVPKVL